MSDVGNNWTKITTRLGSIPRTFKEANRALQLLENFKKLGWPNSVKKDAPIDANGRPLPWFTYPAIAWLRSQKTSTLNIFEYGSGYSTLWWARRARTVLAVEHDAKWARRLLAQLPSNAEIRMSQPTGDNYWSSPNGSPYVDEIQTLQMPPDIVIIDGMERCSCALAATKAMAEDGLLILDNSDRPSFLPALEHLTKEGFQRIDFVGPIPSFGVFSCTSVAFKRPEKWLANPAYPDPCGY